MGNSELLSEISIIDNEQLRAFIAFADHLSFTHAAHAIGLSQPALHERVRRLSEHLEVPLYERHGRALELTSEGVEVLAFARQSLSRSRALMSRLQGKSQQDEVVLAAGEGSYLFLLGSALTKFCKSAQGQEPGLTLLKLGGPATLRAVSSGRAHIGVGVFDVVPRSLSVRSIVTTTICAAIPREHVLARRKRVTLSQLVDERLILAPEGQKHRDIVSRAVAAAAADNDVGAPITADGWSLMLAFAGMGLGVAVVNGICKPPSGIVLRPIPELGNIRYRLVWRKDAHPSKARERLTELICKSCQ